MSQGETPQRTTKEYLILVELDIIIMSEEPVKSDSYVTPIRVFYPTTESCESGPEEP